MASSSPVVLGIDISTYTGLVALQNGEVPLSARVITFPDVKGWRRGQLIARGVNQALDDIGPVECVTIEGYGYGNRHTLVLLVEIGSLIRNVLYERGISWHTIAPTSLKKWTTGSGAATKQKMAASVKQRWGFESSSGSDDVVDAYALAQMARVILASGMTKELKGVQPWM